MIKRHCKAFFLIITVAVLLLIYQKNKGITLEPVGFLKSPVHAVYYSLERISEFMGGIFGRFTVDYQEVELLRSEAFNLRVQTQRLKELENENARLLGVLYLKENTPLFLTAARVIARGEGSWSKVITIDKGSASFVKKDMAVVSDRGLVGKILSVSDYSSTVLLIDDSRFRAAGRLQESRSEGVFSGTGSLPCTLEYVESTVDVMEGEGVITSGLDGLFPPGLSIGYVSKVYRKEKNLFQDIDIMPFADTKKIEEVVVLR